MPELQHEVVQQQIDPEAVGRILFGPDGLVRKAGGGRSPYLMEDIEVAFIKDGFRKSVLSSTQVATVFLRCRSAHAAGAEYDEIKDIKIGVSEPCDGQGELQRWLFLQYRLSFL